MAMVFSKESLCLTVDHCFVHMIANSKSIQVGGHHAKVVARNNILNIACLKSWMAMAATLILFLLVFCT